MSDKKKNAAGGFDARIVLRPRALDETFDLALAYARQYWRDFWRIQLILVGACLLLIAAARALFDLDWLTRWALTLILANFIEQAVTVFAGDHLFGIPGGIRSSLHAVLRHPSLAFLAVLSPLPLVVLLLTRLQSSPVNAVASLALVVWPFLLARAAYLMQVVLLESVQNQSSWRRSGVLIIQRFGRALGMVCSGAVLMVAFAFGAELWTRFVISFLLQLGDPIDTLLENFGSWPAVTGVLLAAPLLALARLFDYVDARTRLDGWDIQVRMKAIAAREKSSERGIAA